MPISLRLSDEDSNIIRSYAKLKRQSISEVVRSAVMEQIETEFDLIEYEDALQEYKRNPVTYSFDEAERELGLR